MDGSATTRRQWAPATLVILACFAGCANYIGTTARSFLRVAREDDDPNRRHLAYSKLADPNCYDDNTQKIEASRLLIERLRNGDEPVASRAIICRTLGEIGRPEAREALIAAVEDQEWIVRAEAVRALGHVAQPEDAILLTRVMTADSVGDCRLAAIESLGFMTDPDPRALLMLVEGMEDEDPAVRLASLRSLRSITGENLGVGPDPWRDLARERVAAATPAPTTPTREGTQMAASPGPGLPAGSSRGPPIALRRVFRDHVSFQGQARPLRQAERPAEPSSERARLPPSHRDGRLGGSLVLPVPMSRRTLE